MTAPRLWPGSAPRSTGWIRRSWCALGDSFHDSAGADRLAADDLATLTRLARGRDWIWVLGNHDPDLPRSPPGDRAEELQVDGLVCRHAAAPGAAGEISGHYHPKAAISGRAGRVTGRCFVADEHRLVLPAFGAYTGGLDVLDPRSAGCSARSSRLADRPRRAAPLPRRPPVADRAALAGGLTGWTLPAADPASCP